MVQMLYIGRYAVYTMQLSMVKSQNGNEKALKHIGFPKIMKYVLIDDRFTFQSISYLRILVQCCLQIHTIYNARSCLTRIYLIAWFPHLTHGNKNFFGAAACNGSSYVKQQLIWWQYVISLEWALCEDKNKLKEHLIYLNGSIVWVVMGWCAFMIVHHDFCLCGYFNHFHCFHRINSLQPHFIKQPCTETFILQKNNEIFAIASLFILLYAVFKIASKKCCFKSLVFRKLN